MMVLEKGKNELKNFKINDKITEIKESSETG